jgi:hypothetical protein
MQIGKDFKPDKGTKFELTEPEKKHYFNLLNKKEKINTDGLFWAIGIIIIIKMFTVWL